MNAPIRSGSLLSAEALAVGNAKSKGFETHIVSNRESWLALRAEDVTASVAGALFGVHEYQTAYGLWALKSGKISEDAEESAPMRRGRLLEPVALQMLAEERSTWHVERAARYFRDAHAHIGATPDALAIDPERDGFGIVQVKTVEPSIFRRKWKGTDGAIEPPLWIAVQAVVEAELTGASWAAVAPLVVGFGVEMPVIEIPLHAGIMAELRTRVADFWRRVGTEEHPPVDYARDGETLAKLYAQDDGTTVDLTGWNQGPVIAAEDAQLAEEIKAKSERRKAIKAEVLEKIGAASCMTIDGRVYATAKTVNRKAYTVAPSSYRDVRIKRDVAA